MAHRPIELRILTNTGVLCLAILGLSAFAVVGILRLEQVGLSFSRDEIPGMAASQTILNNRFQIQLYLEELLWAKGPEERRALRERIQANSARITQAYRDYEQTIFEKEDRDNFEELKRQRAVYLGVRDRYMALLETDRAAAERLFREELVPLANRYEQQATLVNDYNIRRGISRGELLKRLGRKWVGWIAGIVVVSLGAAVAATVGNLRSILAVIGAVERRVVERTREFEAANRELEMFSYSVSHDLRTPLRGINGFCGVLREDYGPQLDAEAHRCLDRISAASTRMGRIIDDLLQLSKATRGELAVREVDLGAMAARVVEGFRAAAPGRSVETAFAPGLAARCDPGLIEGVLENLLGNAWKYTERAQHARIEFDAREEAGERVFRVKDNGAGFDMRFADRLFKNFQRLHDKSEFEGTGIGLAITARIVERHGGRIWAEAEVGKGAAFFFTLEARPGTRGTAH